MTFSIREVPPRGMLRGLFQGVFQAVSSSRKTQKDKIAGSVSGFFGVCFADVFRPSALKTYKPK